MYWSVAGGWVPGTGGLQRGHYAGQYRLRYEHPQLLHGGLRPHQAPQDPKLDLHLETIKMLITKTQRLCTV